MTARATLRYAGCILALSALIDVNGSGQTVSPGTLSDDDRQLVRVILDSALKMRTDWSNPSPVLLDTTTPICDGVVRLGCVDRRHFHDISKTPECAGLNYEVLRDALLARNTKSWRLGTFQTRLGSAPGAELWTMNTKTRVERFPSDRFVDIVAPAYSRDGRLALAYVRGFSLVMPEGWAYMQVFERTGAEWTPRGCTLTISS